MTFIIIIGAAIMWLIFSVIIYAGFYGLRIFAIIPADMVLTLDGIMGYSELILLSVIVAFIAGVILHEGGIIDLMSLLPDKKN